MKALKNFSLVILVGILLSLFASCEKAEPIVPDEEPSKYIEISLKAVADNLYLAVLTIPELDYYNNISGGDETYTWKKINFTFNRENCEGKTIAITIKVFLYPNGYPGDRIEKEETKYVLICDDQDEVVWSFYD